MRLLVVTARYPTPDRPAAGAFVRDRLGDPGLHAMVVAPRRYDRSRWGRLIRLAWDALTSRGRFDGVEAHFVLPTGPIALLAARLRGLPLVVYAHGSDVREISRRSGAHRWLASWVLRSADGVITNSATTAAEIRQLGSEAEVIPPGVDLHRFAASPRPSGRRRVLYLGGDLSAKGIDVARRYADTLVGPGLREVDPDQVPALLADHDVLLVPSRHEGFGLAAAEATAAGRWVVATAVGGLTETVIDGVTGTLVGDGDFGAALATVPDYDPWQLASNAKRFDVTRHREGMARVWDAVLAGRS